MATYHRFELAAQPPVQPEASLDWLDAEDDKPEWAINNSDVTPQLPLTAEAVDLRCGGLPVPMAFGRLAAREELQRRIRSATGCYLDLGDLRVPTSQPGGYLIHLLSDQQWTRHWLLYLDPEGNEGVVTTVQPFGFDLTVDPDWPDPPPVVAELDAASGLDLCAATFAEFIYRFWVENEVFYALRGKQPMAEPVRAYADALRNA